MPSRCGRPAGATFGEPRFKNSFALGGYPDAGGFDIGRANFGLLRGYENDAFRGRKFVSLSAEYRFPLGVPQRGFFSAPAFLRHFHGSVFCDSGNVWIQSFRRGPRRGRPLVAASASTAFSATVFPSREQ